ncbi:MAG: 6-bladed beta-propeller [Nitritalea sp.]
MRQSILLMAGVLFWFACSAPKEQAAEGVEQREFGKFAEVEEFDIVPFFKKSSYVLLDVSAEVALYQADKILAGDGKFFILDAELGEGIFIFEESGAFVAEIPLGGNGPGELPDAEDMAYDWDNQTLLVLGAYGRKLFEFSSEGKYLRDRAFPDDGFYNYIAYAGNGLVYLHTLPSPTFAQSEGAPLLSVLKAENLERVAEHVPTPAGLRYSITGEKPLTVQSGQAVLAPAFGTRIFFFQEEGALGKQLMLQDVAPTDNFYERESFNQFMDLLAERNQLAFADNYVGTKNLELMLLVKSGALTRWGVLNKKNGQFQLAQTLVDERLGLPLLPHLEIHDKKLMKLIEDEFFDMYLDQEEHTDLLATLETVVPGFKNQSRKFILCVYEN